ncbi:hypothetical protein [Paenibacillus sp. Root444D2]|uniref:hypothetical protein n=1 Tax=Paenibacillus sp. Root444D2 TaxID=1736538 RepID=UPI001F2F1A50|nr:hypothetical protein [Paenibacillus sp. Root444D2]
MRQNVNILKPEIIHHNAAAGSRRITVSADVDGMGNVRHQNTVGDCDILGISPKAFSPALARAVERDGVIAGAVKGVIDRYIVGTVYIKTVGPFLVAEPFDVV